MASRLIVVKVGTSGITTNEGNVDEEEIERLARSDSSSNERWR